MSLTDCVYLGEPAGPTKTDTHWSLEFECKHPSILRTDLAKCDNCPQRMKFEEAKTSTPAAQRFGSSAAIRDKYGNPSGLENAWHGGHVFLMLGGPSLKQMDLSKLDARGIVTFGVNQVPAIYRTDIWTYGDTSNKFHEAIWRDPGILKLAPFPKLGNPLRHQREDGQFELTRDTPFDMPNTFGIRRNSTFRPDQYLWEDTVNWGHGKAGLEIDKREGRPARRKVLNTMLQAVRLCYYLGFRHVYLLGCDFRMSVGSYYAFDETKHKGAIKSNTGSYNKVAAMFTELRPTFDDAGFEVLNCNPRSALWAFDHIKYDDAVSRATAKMPQKIATAGWYGRGVIEENENDKRTDDKPVEPESGDTDSPGIASEPGSGHESGTAL